MNFFAAAQPRKREQKEEWEQVCLQAAVVAAGYCIAALADGHSPFFLHKPMTCFLVAVAAVV